MTKRYVLDEKNRMEDKRHARADQSRKEAKARNEEIGRLKKELKLPPEELKRLLREHKADGLLEALREIAAQRNFLPRFSRVFSRLRQAA